MMTRSSGLSNLKSGVPGVEAPFWEDAPSAVYLA